MNSVDFSGKLSATKLCNVSLEKKKGKTKRIHHFLHVLRSLARQL